MQSNLDVTLEEFKGEEERGKNQKGESCVVNSNIGRLEKVKKELLGQIGRVQEELWVEVGGNDKEKI